MSKKVLTLAFIYAFLLTSGCGKTPKTEKPETKVLSIDPVNAFEQIVAEISERAKTPVRFIEKGRFNTGEEFYQKTEYHFGAVLYDIQKTDSLISPLKATVSVNNDIRVFLDVAGSIPNDNELFSDLSACENATVYESEHIERIRQRIGEYLWQNGNWVLTGGTNQQKWPIGQKKYYESPNSSYFEY